MRLYHAAFPLFLAVATGISSHAALAQAEVSLSVALAPPALPIYAQPALPGPGYLWTPGYWAWNAPVGYYWVPGTWVLPPQQGVLWTPGYWGAGPNGYVWTAGYWGPHVGFYGGINYGFGYFGSDYVGGRWEGGSFRYNAAVSNVGHAHGVAVYRQTVSHSNVNHASYSRASVVAAPRGPSATAAQREPHGQRTEIQTQHEAAASADHRLRATENHGRPVVAATPRAGALNDPHVVPAHGAQVRVVPAAARRPAEEHEKQKEDKQ